MIRTRGLSHLALAVRDPEKTARFYARAFGCRAYWRDASQVQVLGPGRWDVLAFERDPARAGKAGGVDHFGFRLASPRHIDRAVEAVTAAGATVEERGEFAEGQPYAFVRDPDGYLVEIWYEEANLAPRRARR